MENLGNDVLVHILSFLPLSSLANVARVCHIWKKFQENDGLWKYKCLKDYDSSNCSKKLGGNNIFSSKEYDSSTFPNLRFQRRFLICGPNEHGYLADIKKT